MRNRNIVRLNESQLHRVIKESVKRVLREMDGRVEDLSQVEDSLEKKAIDKVYAKTESVFENYGIELDNADIVFGRGNGELYLNVESNIEEGSHITDALYNQLCSDLERIGWEEYDGVMVYTLPYKLINTTANRRKQAERAARRNYTDPLLRNYHKRPGNVDNGGVFRDNGSQFGLHDAIKGVSDKELYGRKDWQNGIKHTR